MAELAFGMMLTTARNHYDGTSGFELREKTLALMLHGHEHGYDGVVKIDDDTYLDVDNFLSSLANQRTFQLYAGLKNEHIW